MIDINEVEIITHCHATEDCNKVLQALRNLFPPDLRDEVSFKKQVLHGHYGNIITIFSTKLRGEQAYKIVKHLADSLPKTEKNLLRLTFDLRYDKRGNKLYLRLSKQDAFLGRLILYDSDDVIKMIISFRGNRKPDKILEYLKQLGLID